MVLGTSTVCLYNGNHGTFNVTNERHEIKGGERFPSKTKKVLNEKRKKKQANNSKTNNRQH
jgi:hypothetical protein